MSERAIDELNRIAAEILGETKTKNSYLFWRTPRGWKGRVRKIGYTPWRTRFEGKIGFWALEYVHTAKGWKLRRAVRFGKRKKARQRSLEWHHKYYWVLERE